jgi:hypothetical protein
VSPPDDLHSHSELEGWLLDWFGKLKEKELGVTMLAIYQLWLARNDARDAPMIEDLEATTKRIFFLWDEWQSIKDTPKSRVVQSGALGATKAVLLQGEH